MLHHLGASTQSDVKEVEAEVSKHGRKSVIVEGDIALPETAKKVRFPPAQRVTYA